MLEEQVASRINFFEQLQHQFLYIKGYGAYAYITSRDVDQLYDSYIVQQEKLAASLTPQPSEVSFIRSFIKSL